MRSRIAEVRLILSTPLFLMCVCGGAQMEPPSNPGRKVLSALEDAGLTGALLLLDPAAAELIRWSGGLSYIIDELGAALAVDIQDDLRIKAGAYKKACVLLTTFVWEFEHPISKLAGLFEEVLIYTSLPSEAHARHPQATQILGDMGRDPFSTLAAQFATIPGMTQRLRVSYLPLHIYNTIQPPPPAASGAHKAYERLTDILAGGTEGSQSVLDATAEGPGVFVTCSPDCYRAYPLQLSDFIASNPRIQDLSQVVADDIPTPLRMGYRSLTQALAGALRHQLRVDVGGGIFALGKTSQLLGASLARALEGDNPVSANLVNAAAPIFASPGGLGLSGGGPREPLSQASIILLDRTMDLSTSLAKDLDSLLQKIVDVLPKGGKRAAARGGLGSGGVADEESGLEDVGVNPPHLLPVLDKHNPTPAFPALAAFPWQAPPSICHPYDSVAGVLVKAMASVREADAHVLLRRALNTLITRFECTPPPPKRRGPGAEVMALLNSLSSKGPSVCHKSRGVLQVALAVVETLQRTKDSTWDEMAASQKVLRQSLRERPDDVTLTALLLKCLQSSSLSLPDALGLCLFALTLLGDAPTPQLRLTLRDALVHRIRSILPQTFGKSVKEAISTLAPLPRDLVGALWQCGREGGGGQQQAALDMELVDVIEEDFLRRFEDVAIARRRLHTPSLRDLVREDPRSDCATLVGRLSNLLLTGDDNELEQLSQDVVKVGGALQHLSSGLGFGLLASQISKLGGALRGGNTPANRPVIIIFVLGGLTYQEVREVTMITKAAKLMRNLGSSGEPRTKATIILGSTSIATPESILLRTLNKPGGF